MGMPPEGSFCEATKHPHGLQAVGVLPFGLIGLLAEVRFSRPAKALPRRLGPHGSDPWGTPCWI